MNTLVEKELKQHKVLELSSVLKELYIQAQNWARHNENLIVASNSFLITIICVLTAVIFRKFSLDDTNFSTSLLLPIVISLIGIVLTKILSRRYLESLERVIKYEKMLGCHRQNIPEILEFNVFDDAWGTGLIPLELHQEPKSGPESSILFLVVHSISFLCYSVIYAAICFFKFSYLPFKVRTNFY